MKSTRNTVALPDFEWKDMPGASISEWRALLLVATDTGRWSVAREDGKAIVTEAHQVAGSDLQDAKRRAQGVALILHDLSVTRYHTWNGKTKSCGVSN